MRQDCEDKVHHLGEGFFVTLQSGCVMHHARRSDHPQLLENLPQRRCCSPRPLDSEWRISATLGWAASVPIPRGLGIKLSFHGMAPVVFTFWEAAPADAVLVDPQDDGIGANKDVKDSQASMGITCLGKLYVVTEMVVGGGKTEWKIESGQLSEHDKY